MAPRQVVSESIQTDFDVSPNAPTDGIGRRDRQGGPSVTRASQDWVGENLMVKTKSPTLDERWEGPRSINGDAAHSIRLVF